MFDKIQSTYFKRVTTGVLALFMTASSGFSYAVPVYAEEVTTAAAKRKKEEEFSSTESSTLQLNENSTKEEVKNNQDTGNDDVNVTTNGSSEDQPEVTYEKPDTKEPGRKLSSEEAQKDLKKIIEGKKYSYEAILQRIFEIDDFSFYSSLTSDDIKFLMSGKTEEKYEILEILKLKSVNYYDYNSLSPKKFYLSLFSYFKLIDQCDEELSKDVKKQIQDQVLKDINQFYIKEESQYYENINDFYVNDMQDFENVSKEDGAKYVDAISTYIYTKSDERDKNVIRKALDLEEVDEETDEKELEDWATNNKDGSFTIKDHLDSLKGTEESYNQGGDYGYSTNNYFYVTIHDNDGNDTNATINITGRSSKYGNKDKALYQRMLKNETTWNCSMTINGANNHNLGLTHNTVTTKQDKFKGTDGKYAWFVMNFKISYTRHAYYYNKGCSYDKNDKDIRFNTKNYTLQNTGDDGNSIEKGYTSYDKPVTANIQINTGHTGTRTFNHYRYRGGRVTINYTREKHTIRYDANGGSGAPGNQTKTMGVDLWLSSTTPSRPQYVFKGWNTEANGSGTSYSPGQQFYPDADTTLYAQWEEDTSYQYLDVNGVLDGNQAYNTDGMGKFDVYIDGQLVSDPAGSIDFYDKYKVGSKYEIKNIRPNSGISYDHASPGLSGTITGYTSVDLYFNTGYTLSIDPNGGTYLGSTSVHKVNHLSPGSYVNILVPTRPGYKFGGYDTSHGDYQYFASNNGWTTSHGENVGTYSRSYDGNVSLNEAPDGGYYRTNHVWRGIDSATDNYNYISFPTYTAEAGHTYKISGEVWISERPSGGSFALNFYHGDSSNDWKHCMWGISEGWTGKWVKFSMERTFDTTTNDARFEIWTSNLKGLTGNISFWLQGLKITDETTGNDVSMTKIAMGNSDIKLTARWIPLHSTLSYDAQGGSLDSVKSTDNPNNYKIVDNGDYFIQSGLNSSRYLHDYDCSRENGAKVCTFQGYGANAKQCIWTFERYKNTPYYYIINKYNGKALNLSGDGPGDLSGQTVEMWTQLNAANENQSDFLWYFKDAGDGYVTICNKYTDKALDIPNGEDNDNVKLQQYTPNGTASQKFKLVNNSQVYFPTREKYTDSNVYINSATPVKKGCKFLGWSTSANGNVVYQPGDLYDVNQDGGNVTLYAKWEKAKYTATVKLNGGSYNGSTKDFTISKYPGEEISIGAPTRSKHNFTGYKLTMDNNDGNAPTSVTQSASGFKGIMQMGNFTLNAQWTPWKHTVRYDANAKNDTSVKGIPASQSKTANVDIKLSSSVPTRNGYTFLGWNTKADGKGTAYAAGAIYKNDQNGGTVTLYAQWTPWKHVLHYNKNVPTSSTSQTVSNMPVDQTKTFGQLMTISNLVPTRKGYTFAGWYTQSNGTGTKYDPGSNYAADQNGGTVNLYAKWTPWTYNIKYDQNVKSTSSSKTVTDMPAAQTKTQEIDVTLSSMTPKRNGYIFAGWSTSANGSVEYKPGSRFTKDLDSNGASITLYAVWTPWKHTIHYNSNIPTNAPTGTTTVSNMPNDQTKTFDEKLMISSNKPTRKGYNFAGWSTSANGNVVYQPGAEYKNDQNGGTVTLYAKWTAWEHTVTYDKNVPTDSKKTDVKNMPENQTKIYDQNLTLRSNVPTRIGYTFVKWTTNKDGTGTAYQPGSQYSYNRDSDGGTVTLYAVWTPWKYTVRYDKNVPASSSSQTVSNMPADQTKTEEVVLTLSSNKPSRNGYIFNGWQAQINGKTVDYQPGAKLSYDPDVKGSVITLKAKWTAWKHTIHYDKNVSASSSSQTVANMPEDDTKTFDITKTVSSTKPSRNGYIFNGWNTQKDGKGTAYASGAAYKHDQNGGTVTLYAQWTPWKHTVTYDKNVDPSSSSQTVTNMPGNQTKTFDEKLMISSTKPSRNGYIFNGWNTQKDGKGTAYASGAEYKHDQNGGTVTLYAQWTPWKHTVHYNANGGDQNSVPTDQIKTFDQAMILSDKKPTRHGYNFVRWNTKADGTGTSYEVKGNYNHDQNGGTVTLYAIWTPWVHTVHYDANGGDQSSVPNDQKKTYGQSMNVATKVPTRNEYKFLGWTTGKDGSGTFYNPGDAYYHDQNGQTVTLYAKWIQLYTVKYDGNQPAIKGVTVTGSVANQTQGQDESVNLRTNNFKNNSGIYKDWSVGKDAYKYAVKNGTFRKYIHPEGYGTKHDTMQKELREYVEGMIRAQN